MKKQKPPLFNELWHQVLVSIGIIITSLFGVWWFQVEHIPNNFAGIWHIMDIILFLIVSYMIWHPIVMTSFSWLVASHIIHRDTPKPQNGLKVAFLTTFVPQSESIDLLHQCLPAMVEAKYPHDTWLLDEGDSTEARAICKKYGVQYFTRYGLAHYNQEEGKYKAKTKGGNHNSWHDTHGHKYDIIAQIDTDFVPKDTFLTKTLGYFRDPKIGFVGTPQIYGNIEQSFIARGAAEQSYNFYGPGLRGLDGMRMNTLIGANHIVRVKALESVDHYSAHITEDLITGMKLHSRGWSSIYVPEVLAIGEGPSTWQAFFSQQMRWAYGCMDVLFKYSFDLFKSMTWRQRIYYFVLQQHYFSGIVMILGIAGLVIYFSTGINLANISLIPFLVFYLPIMGVMSAMSFWLQKFNIRPNEERGMFWAGRIISIASWPIFFLAFIGLLRGKKLTYKVTPKGKGMNQHINENSLSLFIPHFIIACISFIGLVSIFFTGRDSIILVFWALVTFISMILVPFTNNLALFINNIRYFIENNTGYHFKDDKLTFITHLKYLVIPTILCGLFIFIYVNVFYTYSEGIIVNQKIGLKPIQLLHNKKIESPVKTIEEIVTEEISLEDYQFKEYTFFAEYGDGVTSLARKAIKSYTKDNNIILSTEQKIFAETKLKNIYYRQSLKIGESITFENSVLKDTIDQANNLSSEEISIWSNYIN